VKGQHLTNEEKSSRCTNYKLLKSTIQIDANEMKSSENGKFQVVLIAKHTDEHVDSVRVTPHAERAATHSPHESNCISDCTYACVHACTHPQVHTSTCNIAPMAPICSARKRTMKLRPWYMLLLIMLSAVHATRWFIVLHNRKQGEPNGTLCCQLCSREFLSARTATAGNTAAAALCPLERSTIRSSISKRYQASASAALSLCALSMRRATDAAECTERMSELSFRTRSAKPLCSERTDGAASERTEPSQSGFPALSALP